MSNNVFNMYSDPHFNPVCDTRQTGDCFYYYYHHHLLHLIIKNIMDDDNIIRKSNKNIRENKVTVVINEKRKRRRVKVGDPDFAPPDGGWGWFVVFACGFSNLSIFPMFQQFGLIFEQKFELIGITQTQKTCITNFTSACNALVGLTNGPVYRKFSFRQVSGVFSLLTAAALFSCVFCSSFIEYLLCYCVLYGSSFGFVQSANSLALNTYFKEKRRIATGFSWTTTALGPILWPFIIVFLENYYGMDGVLMIFSAFALHSFVCALLLQPVEWHTKFKDEVVVVQGTQSSNRLSRISSRIFGSHYFGNEDDPVKTGYEITDPGTPMMLRSNDGFYSRSQSQLGSRLSLTSNKLKQSETNSRINSKRPSMINLNVDNEKRERKKSFVATKNVIKEDEEANFHVLENAARKLKIYEREQQNLIDNKFNSSEMKKNNLWQKFVIFFDFDLLKDPVYLNLMVGITIANFTEINFSILTPIILTEFGFTKYQIATFMSLLGATDIIVRFFIPFVADKIGWNNRVFFLIGIMSMGLGRIVLAHCHIYLVALPTAVLIGAGKALRTIFIALVIPSHVPLEKLPAASGLQLAFCGIFYVAVGPCVGWMREVVGNYSITLHLLNLCTYACVLAWIIEMYISNKNSK